MMDNALERATEIIEAYDKLARESKIAATKVVRGICGMGLKEAKDFMETQALKTYERQSRNLTLQYLSNLSNLDVSRCSSDVRDDIMLNLAVHTHDLTRTYIGE